jgi:hypothetical protein
MQHSRRQMGSQTGFVKVDGFSVTSTSKLIGKDFTATFADVRPILLTLVLITQHRGAA